LSQPARPTLSALLSCLAVAACTSTALREEPPQGGSGGQAGRPAVVVTEDAIQGNRGCRLDYRLYSPASANPKPDTLVVIGHGFLRNRARMAGHAQAIAAAGYHTASVTFCNSRIWDGRHRDNGRDMVRLANALDARRVVYLGFSAGGLAALLAGQQDPRTLGVVALDLVDRDGIGLAAARGFDRPLIGLVGPPSECNAGNNGLPVLAASQHSQVHRFPEATHCDFEAPTDWLCDRVCGTRPGGEQRRAEILQATAEAVRTLAPIEAPAGS